MTHPLLTPRYMVEADYPNSRYTVGQVIDATSDDIVSVCDKYPKIFRLMHWSEGRSLDEMPRYLRRKEGVIHVQQYYSKDTGVFVSTLHSASSYPIEWYTPATEAEYLEYLKSKEK